MIRIKTAAATLTLLCAAFNHGAWAISAKPAPQSRIWLEGDSTLHAFSSSASSFDLQLSLEAPQAGDLAAGVESQAGAKMTLRIPVAGLKSDKKGLDKNLQKALKAEEHPEIVYTLNGYRLEKGSTTVVVASGDLTVAGVTKPQTVSAALSRQGALLVLEGEQPLLMTDFNVKPPKMMMGAIKTDDRVVIKFRLELEQAADETMKEETSK